MGQGRRHARRAASEQAGPIRGQRQPGIPGLGFAWVRPFLTVSSAPHIRVLCSSERLCLSRADWCLQSDALPVSRLFFFHFWHIHLFFFPPYDLPILKFTALGLFPPSSFNFNDDAADRTSTSTTPGRSLTQRRWSGPYTTALS